MATGAQVTAGPIYGDMVLREQDYSDSWMMQDPRIIRGNNPQLVIDSKTFWVPPATAAVARRRLGHRITFDPKPTSNGNKRAFSFYDIFYERIHYDPAVMRLGQLLNAQERTISVWNAYFEPRTLEAVGGFDDEGLELNVGALPQVFRPLQEKTFSLSISVEGPPTIDARYEFRWDNGTYNYRVTGERIVVLAFPPDYQQDFTEQLKWYGTINQAYNGKEQRMALNILPKITYNYRLQLVDEELQLFDSIMWGWQNRAFAVPVWNSYTYTSQDIGQGTTTLFVESTAGREFAVDKLAIIYASAGMYEAVEVLEVQADRLLLKKPVARNWTKRVPVLPARTMRMSNEISYTGPVANFREVDMVLISETGENMPGVPWPENYKGRPVLNFSPDMAGGISGSYTRNMDWEDGQYSLPLIVDKSGVGTPRQVWQYTWDSYQEAQQFKSLLQTLCGQTGTFWISTWAPDITITSVIEVGANSFIATFAQHAAMYFDRRGRRDIVINLRDGTNLYREINNVGPAPEGVEGELFVLTGPFQRRILPHEIRCVSYLTESRFENETFEFNWKQQGWVSMNAMIKGLTDGL